MNSSDKSFVAIVTIGLIALLIIIGILSSFMYMNQKLKLEQPKYFIEFKGDVYELEKVE